MLTNQKEGVKQTMGRVRRRTSTGQRSMMLVVRRLRQLTRSVYKVEWLLAQGVTETLFPESRDEGQGRTVTTT